MQECYIQKLITSDEIDVLLRMLNDRTEIMYTYNYEEIAEVISKNISQYYKICHAIIEKIKVD